MRIDTHQHFWAINDTDYVWMTAEHEVIRRDFLPSDLRPLLDASAIDGTIAVQARQMVRETEWLLDLADRNPWIRGVVGWVPLVDRNVALRLEQYGAHPRFVGVRHVVHDEPDDDFLLRPDFNEGVRQLAAHGLVYDILIFWRHLPQTLRFVDAHPYQSFVVDHIAKPRISRNGFDREWAFGMRELARRDHVVCKVSGMTTEVRDASWDVDLLRPYFDTVLDAFGPERILYGSDWPVSSLRTGYAGWVDTVRELASGLTPGESEAFWGGNARRIYGIP